MSNQGGSENRGAAAGGLLVASIAVGAGLGLAVSQLTGYSALVVSVGGALGLVLGFWLLYRTFKDI